MPWTAGTDQKRGPDGGSIFRNTLAETSADGWNHVSADTRFTPRCTCSCLTYLSILHTRAHTHTVSTKYTHSSAVVDFLECQQHKDCFPSYLLSSLSVLLHRCLLILLFAMLLFPLNPCFSLFLSPFFHPFKRKSLLLLSLSLSLGSKP